jgi:hypothetical protein
LLQIGDSPSRREAACYCGFADAFGILTLLTHKLGFQLISPIVVVTKLDRLGRSTRELLDLIDRIGEAGVQRGQ